ncbi:hypothetical protein JOAD_19 [Erwinia phage vB_EamM_Joad]|uniref:Uncharacterized protein n=1 Tax=Erwinia phage vB_EamM_Joad TaxID=2026081 RepID=A0A223LJY2_9CAUD|nr:hypothetical protein JOAD_19 [Erwinia phage vB_EamM_Joad]
MYPVDIVNLAKMLRTGSVEASLDAVCIYAERAMEHVVELVNLNDPLQENILIDDLIMMYEVILPGIDTVSIIKDYVTDVREAMKRNYWDPRCKVKLIKQRLNKRYYRVHIVMDLELTAANLYNSVVDSSVPVHLEDVVDDNPSPELLAQYEQKYTDHKSDD